MTVREPNLEQKKAIEHNGGVLLAAGAGSGKTFVLVEHIVYLLNVFLEQNKKLDDISFQQKVKSYLSSIVLMTFTKKAAGEISLRLAERVASQNSFIEYGSARAEIIKESICFLNVSTIHGFCFKLLTQGFFSDFDPEVKILNELEFKSKIKKLFSQWYSLQQKNKDKIIWPFVSANSDKLCNAFENIFSDPEIRLMWQNYSLEEQGKETLASFLEQYIKMSGLDEFIQSLDPLDSALSALEKKPAWAKFYESFEKIKKKNVDNYEALFFESIEYFDGITRLTGPNSKADNEFIQYFEKMKEWREFIKKSSEDLIAYNDNKKEIFSDWLLIVKNAFDYINLNYKKISGIIFADMEYYVRLGLDSDQATARISNVYKYFIIDEFQDTSRIQFDIIKIITGLDYSKIFCVGDLKQAIYGFRGGEIGVFEDCLKHIPLALNLTNNYRSEEKIINFNNKLFSNIFKKGLSFKGDDNYAVDVEFQTYPFGSDSSGRIYKKKLLLEGEGGPIKTLKATEIDENEADEIFSIIKKSNGDLNGEICVLYSKLGPSGILINKLIKDGISFSAQMKVSTEEDPLINIFLNLVEFNIVANDPKLAVDRKKTMHSHTLMMLECYFDILNLKVLNLADKIYSFMTDVTIVGLAESFKKFCFISKIYNSNYVNNIILIESICEMNFDDISSVWKGVKQDKGRYSIDFQFGSQNKNVIIMTTHASKGLEFEHIILGGIHTNGRKVSNKTMFGKFPGSFKWKKYPSQKSTFKSPQLIIEEYILKQKDFAESKRLFYVACTRAESQISWCDVGSSVKDFSFSKDSWINGIRSWEKEANFDGSVSIDEEVEVRTLTTTQDDIFAKKPFFHIDNLGLGQKIGDIEVSLGPISELSVTKLATIASCPRKFFLKNICKLDAEDVLDIIPENRDEDEQISEDSNLEHEAGDRVITSSSSRGTFIHEQISLGIIGSYWETEDLSLSLKDRTSIDWALALSKNKKDLFELISEKPIKFSHFGQMVSGTPDLVLTGKNKELEVWDFKTGSYTENKSDPYWFQLACYGYAYVKLLKLDSKTKVKLNLVFVDEQQEYHRELDETLLIDMLFKNWQKLDDLSQVNLHHCQACEFGNICHFKTH